MEAAWDRALDEGYDQALDTVINRIHDGILVPIIYRGRQVGVKRKHDNKLLMAALNLRARLREAGAPKEEWDF